MEPLFFCSSPVFSFAFPSFFYFHCLGLPVWEERKGRIKENKKAGLSLEEFLKAKNPELIEEIIWNDFEEVVFQCFPDLNFYKRLLMELDVKKFL